MREALSEVNSKTVFSVAGVRSSGGGGAGVSSRLERRVYCRVGWT